MDVVERNARSKRAEAVVADLTARGVVAFATTFVDNSGIARVKVVPLRWEHKQNSRVAPVRDTLLMLSDVVRVRVNDWRGAYA